MNNVVTMTVPLHIVTEGPPVYTSCRKLHGEKKAQVEEQLRQWKRYSIIQRCELNWASPIHAVKKSDDYCVCGYFRRLNAITKLDKYPLPALSTFNEQLAGCTVFSKVDLKQAFQQVCVDESSQEKTAIINTLGLYKFRRMPYGLKHATQCFQWNVHQLLSDLPVAHIVYLDDVIVGDDNKEDHIRYLRCIFQKMKDTGLLLRKEQVCRSSIKFLGHIVDSQGISIPPDRADDIKRLPQPKTPKDLGVLSPFRASRIRQNGITDPIEQHQPSKGVRRSVAFGACQRTFSYRHRYSALFSTVCIVSHTQG